MSNNGIAYRGYTTHDPDEAIGMYSETFGVEPTIILIRPGYPVTKDHPILLESKFCGYNVMMLSDEIDTTGYRSNLKKKEYQRQQRKTIDGKLLRQLRKREKELEDAREDDTTYFTDDDKEREKASELEDLKKEWVRNRPNILTDDDYLRLKESHGYIYLMASDNDFHKIGRSIDVEDRRSQLEREIPVVIEVEHYFASKYYIGAEAYMHDRYAEYRTGRYEWFKLQRSHIEDFKTFKDYELDKKLEKLLLDQR